MPKKKKGGKKKKAKKSKMIGNETPDMVLNRFLRTYERNCVLDNSVIPVDLKKAIINGKDNEALLTKFVLNGEPPLLPEDPVARLEPLILALRQERYVYIKDLHVWDMPLNHEQLASLGLLLEKGTYPLRMIELMDCLIESYPIKRLSLSFSLCSTLSHICFDYNEFGDAGCKGLCEGLENNKTIISLSLNYCNLEMASGQSLGNIVSTTAVRELFVDGNNLECEGVVEIIKLCADNAEEEAYQREEEARIKAEEEDAAAEKAKQDRYHSSAASDTENQEKPGSAGTTDKTKKKKKKGKKKSKEPPPPPRVGPWIHKLHIADNGIDMYGNNQGCIAPLVCMRLFRKLIANSECFEELDLEDNMIGDLGGREVLEALMDRKEGKLPGIKVRTTHRMSTDTLNSIIKLGAGLKKKKKRGKKKKK